MVKKIDTSERFLVLSYERDLYADDRPNENVLIINLSMDFLQSERKHKTKN